MSENYQNTIKKLVESFGTWYEDEQKLEYGRMTSKLYPYDRIFSPIQINSIKVKNRIVMAPMGNISMCEETGRPNDKMIDYFVERAKGGTGLITSGLIPISHKIDPSVTENEGLSYFPRIDRSRTVFAGWRDIAERLHGYGSKFFIQLTPGLGRVGSPECLINKKKFPVSASWNPNFYMPSVPCKPISTNKCNKIIKNIGQAAVDAKSALIDGVYLHGHEGYLLEQMTNPAFNRRKLGEFSDWQAFGIKAVKEIRRRCGDRYPIMYRIDLSLVLNETYGERMKSVKPLKKFINERTVEMTLDYMKNLVKAGVDIFDVDLGCYDNWWLPHPPGAMPPGCFLEVSRIAKEHFKENNILSNAGIEVPIVAVGKLGYPDLSENAIRNDMCDMIMLGRPLLADPYWPQKAYAGKVDEIRPCIGDQEGCLNEFVEGGHPQCVVNPRTAFEHVYKNKEIMPAQQKKKVAVVGAGPAGIMTACIASERGHDVTIFEKNNRIGGLLAAGSVPKIKYDIVNYIKYMEKQIDIHKKQNGLKLELNTKITVKNIKEGNYDAVVISTGTKQLKPPVQGAELPQVVYGVDLLLNPTIADGAKKVVVVGGGVVGCETAYFLRHELGKEVKIIEMLPHFMKGVCTANRGFLIHHLEKINVELLNCTKLKSVQDKSVTIIKNISKTVPDPYVTWTPILPDNIENPLAKKIEVEEKEITLDADLVVMAIGGRPDDTLYFECQKEKAAPEIYNIGDSFSQGRVFEATKAAYGVGRLI
jgi:2-enoate reductase